MNIVVDYKDGLDNPENDIAECVDNIKASIHELWRINFPIQKIIFRAGIVIKTPAVRMGLAPGMTGMFLGIPFEVADIPEPYQYLI